MMKNVTLFLLCVSAGFAGYSDGFITEGEYEFMVTWKSDAPPLIVDGGGADRISVRDSGRLIVKSTSKPLSLYTFGGVYDIYLLHTSQLLYLDGVTEFIRVGQNATAVLMGGDIKSIKTMRYPVPDEATVFIYAQDGWTWIDGDRMKGIEGKWLESGADFRIEFNNDMDYGPVWQNLKVIPEPATSLLFIVGAAFLGKFQKYSIRMYDD